MRIIVSVYSGEAERRLLQDLLAYYQKFERPVANEADAVQLKFGLTLQQIMDVVSNSLFKFQRASSQSVSQSVTKPFRAL